MVRVLLLLPGTSNPADRDGVFPEVPITVDLKAVTPDVPNPVSLDGVVPACVLVLLEDPAILA